MMTPVRMLSRLTLSERTVLKWLSREDSSALGECDGQDLRRLIGLNLVLVKPSVDHPSLSRVSLTQLGQAVALLIPEGR